MPIALYLVTLGVLHAKDAGDYKTLVRALVISAVVLAIGLAGWEMGLTVLLIGVALVLGLVEYLVFDRDPGALHENEARAARGESVENMHG